jgi:hypothetical protein
MEKFKPLSPDPFLVKNEDMSLAKFGHMNALVDAINTSSFPQFTTDLDTEIQVGTVSEGGVIKDLFYKRFQLSVVAGGGNMDKTVTYVPNLIKTSFMIEMEMKGVFFQMSLFDQDPTARAVLVNDDNKGTMDMFVNSDSTFNGSYRITYELWYMKGASVAAVPPAEELPAAPAPGEGEGEGEGKGKASSTPPEEEEGEK